MHFYIHTIYIFIYFFQKCAFDTDCEISLPLNADKSDGAPDTCPTLIPPSIPDHVGLILCTNRIHAEPYTPTSSGASRRGTRQNVRVARIFARQSARNRFPTLDHFHSRFYFIFFLLAFFPYRTPFDVSTERDH